MYEDVKKIYQFSSWTKRLKDKESILVKNFVPLQEDFKAWERTSKERYAVSKSRRNLRTIWESTRDKNSRMLVDVHETSSGEEARLCLLEILANNELARLPDGPDDLGNVSFIHPEGVPPAAFWVTGNLCMSVCSIGPEPVRVLDYGHRLHSRIMEKPPSTENLDLALTSKEKYLSLKKEVGIGLSLPEPVDEDVCIKYFASGGELYFKGDEVYLRAQQEGKILVEVFAMRPDKRSFGGRIGLIGKQ